jgi:hypothetical protein
MKSRRIRWTVHAGRMGRKQIQGFGGKNIRKETTRKA